MNVTLVAGKTGLRCLLAVLLGIGLNAGAETKTRVTTTDKTTVRQPERAVKVTTETRQIQSRTVSDGGQWATCKSGTQVKTREIGWHGETGETTWEGEAGRFVDTKTGVEAKIGNSTTREIGGTRLKNGETVWTGETGPSYRKTVRGDLGTLAVKADAGADGKVRLGDNGVEAQGKIGVEASLKANTVKMAIGDKKVGASFKGTAKLEVAAVAKGKMGAYVDEKGITFGAQGSAGVYAKGEVKLNFEAHVFGVKTNVNLIASGYAGALAEGKAVATLGWNGKVSFMASIGASLGLGCGFAVEFEMDAEELMKRLNLTDLSQLLAWLKAFQENPKAYLAQLGIQALRKVHEAGYGVIRKLGQDAAKIFENEVMKPLRSARRVIQDGVGKGLAFLGRLIKAPASERANAAVDTCLQQAVAHQMDLPDSSIGRRSTEFPVCLAEGINALTGLNEWEGIDFYGWFPFDWPAPFQWPSL